MGGGEGKLGNGSQRVFDRLGACEGPFQSTVQNFNEH